MTRRLPAIAAIVVVLVAAGLVDRHRHHAPVEQVAAVQPRGAPASASSSSWYCAGGTAVPGGVADSTIVVLNAGSTPLHGTVTFVPSAGDPHPMPIDVPASTRVSLHAADSVVAPYVAATIQLDGGQAAAELLATGPLGPSVSPCASVGSRQWYFAEGTTTKDANEVISVFNPFPEDAVVDVSFQTEDGTVAPEPLSGMVVKAKSLQAVPVGDYAHRRQVVSATIAARVGRVVADRLETFDGSAGRKGTTLALGAPDVGRTWYFPEGLVVDGLAEKFQIFNPGDTESAIEVAFGLEHTESEPLQLRIPPGSRLTVDANSEPRVPKGVPHATTVRVLSGDGVVAERTIDASLPGRTGVAWTLGARAPSTSWAFAAGEASDAVDEWVTVQNPGARPAVVSVGVLGDGQRIGLDGMEQVTVAPGQHMAWRIADRLKRPTLSLLVVADHPIVAERGLYESKVVGTVMTVGDALG